MTERTDQRVETVREFVAWHFRKRTAIGSHKGAFTLSWEG
jgi:hypothetical protein